METKDQTDELEKRARQVRLGKSGEAAVKAFMLENPAAAAEIMLRMATALDALNVVAVQSMAAVPLAQSATLPAYKVALVTREARLANPLPEAAEVLLRDVRSSGEDLAPDADIRAIDNAKAEGLLAEAERRNPDDPFVGMARILNWCGESGAEEEKGAARVRKAMLSSAILRR